MQDGTANLNALAPMARLMGAGDVMVEYDQRYEHFAVAPAPAARAGAGADAPGLVRPRVVRHAPAQRADRVDAQRAGPGRARPIRRGRRRSSTTPCPIRGRLLRGESEHRCAGDGRGRHRAEQPRRPGHARYGQRPLLRRHPGDGTGPPPTAGVAGRAPRGHRHQPQGGVPLGHPHRQRGLHRDARATTRPRRT